MASNNYSKSISRLLENTADLSLKRKARVILTQLNSKSTDKILEVGCGDGYYLSIINQLGKFYNVGLEYDPKALQNAERNFTNLGIKYKKLNKWQDNLKKGAYLIQGDVNKMPFEDDFFDKVIMSEVAEHLPNDLKGLKEVYRCIKKDGLLLLTVPNSNYPFLWDPINWTLEKTFKTHIKSGFFAGIWNQHVRLYSKGQIIKVLEKAGFLIEECEVQTRWSLPFNHYLINLGARLLAAKVLPDDLAKQANKFDHYNSKGRSPLIEAYLNLAKFADSFNKSHHPRVGTTIFVKAQKRSIS